MTLTQFPIPTVPASTLMEHIAAAVTETGNNVTSSNDAADRAAASAVEAGLYDGIWVNDVSNVLTNNTFSYTAAPGKVVINVGDYLRTRKEGIAYKFAPSGATDNNATTAGGVKLYLMNGADGSYPVQAMLSDFSGQSASDAAIAAVLSAIPNKGGRLAMPTGVVELAAPLSLTREDLSISGTSQKATEIRVAHTGVGLSFEGQNINLPDCKIAISDMLLTRKSGNTLNGSGFPQAGWNGTAIKLVDAFGCDFQRLQVDRFNKGLDLGSVYQSTFNQYLARNCWMGLVCSAEGDGKSTGNTFIGGYFNNSAFDLTNGEKFAFVGTDFEASSTTCIISDRNIFQNCRFERMNIGRNFFTWLRIDGEFNKLIGSQFFWDAFTTVNNAQTDFYVEVNGSNNEIEAQKLFTHQNFIRFGSTAKNNTVVFNAPFTDFTNTGNNNLYRRSGRLFVDKAASNRIVFENPDGRVDTFGDKTHEATGALSNYLRYDALSNLTVNAGTLTIAQSNIQGPCKIPATHVDNRLFTIASNGAVIRATTPVLAIADGNTVYSISCYIQIPNVSSPVTRVRIGDSSGAFTDIYPSDGTNIWHRVVMFTQPANGDPVQFMIESDGDIGDFFYVALPSAGRGNVPAYVPVPPNKTTWTVETTAQVVTTDDVRNPFGLDQVGVNFTPAFAGFTGTVSTAVGKYTKRGDMVDFTIRFTGSNFSASAFAASVALPFAGGDGSLVASNTDASSNLGVGLVLNGTAYLPGFVSTNSLQIQGSYRLSNV